MNYRTKVAVPVVGGGRDVPTWELIRRTLPAGTGIPVRADDRGEVVHTARPRKEVRRENQNA